MSTSRGRYIYGVASTGCAVSLGGMGIDGSEVYTIPYDSLCAIVHNCSTEPYQSTDEERVKKWVSAHQGVLDEAKERFGTIIPFGFDTILRPRDEAIPPDQVVRDWLKGDYERLQPIMQKIRDRDEYGVQVFYEPRLIGKQISEHSPETVALTERIKREMAAGAPGIAYICRQRLEWALKEEMEKLADKWFKDFYGRVRHYCDDIMVEKTKKAGGDRVMLLNISCLVVRQKVNNLGEELEKINNMPGFSVHFSGPWPPYSFVAKPAVPAGVGMK